MNQSDMAGVSGGSYKDRSDLWHRHVLLDRGPPRSQSGFPIHHNGGHGIYPSLRGQANAYLGHIGNVVESTPSLA